MTTTTFTILNPSTTIATNINGKNYNYHKPHYLLVDLVVVVEVVVIVVQPPPQLLHY